MSTQGSSGGKNYGSSPTNGSGYGMTSQPGFGTLPNYYSPGAFNSMMGGSYYGAGGNYHPGGYGQQFGPAPSPSSSMPSNPFAAPSSQQNSSTPPWFGSAASPTGVAAAAANPFAATPANTGGTTSGFGPPPPQSPLGTSYSSNGSAGDPNANPNSPQYAAWYNSLPPSTRAYAPAPGSQAGNYTYGQLQNNPYSFANSVGVAY